MKRRMVEGVGRRGDGGRCARGPCVRLRPGRTSRSRNRCGSATRACANATRERAEQARERAEQERERAEQARERFENLYEQGQNAIERAQWTQAVERFTALVSAKAPRADAALYWRAYSLDKLNRQAEALTVGRRTAQGLPVEPVAGRRARARDPGAAACGSAGVAGGAGRRGTEAIRDSGPPAPGPGPGHPDAREAAAGHQFAAAQGARAVRAGAEQRPARAPGADDGRSRRIQPGPAAEGHPVHRHERVATQSPAARGDLRLVDRHRREAADSSRLHDGGRSRARARGGDEREVAGAARAKPCDSSG